MNRRVLFTSCAVLFLFSAQGVSANHEQQVLGESTVAVNPVVPATSDGPGLILPDSPLYFLDTFKQNIRLFLAFSPEQKAEVHATIAGERIAELRYMVAKNNEKGIDRALTGVTDHLEKSSEQLEAAELKGENVTTLAQTLNEDIKSKRGLLEELEDTSTGELKEKVKVAKKSLLKTKVKVEDSLPKDQLNQEIADDLSQEIEDEVEDASHSARGLDHAISVLERNASIAAEKNQLQREAALRHAIEVKNEALRRQQEQGMQKDKQQNMLRQEELKAARESVNKAQEAATRFKEAKKRTEEMKKESSETTSTENTSSTDE